MANSKMETVSLEWTYSPKNYFEEPIKTENNQYILEINNGDVRVTMDWVDYNQDSNIRKRLEDEVLAYFRGGQVASYRIFNLSDSSVIQNHSDGKGTIFQEVASELKMEDSVDVILFVLGNIVEDTKSDRMREQREFADLSAKYSDTDDALNAILLSNNASVNDPDNVFVHLYEICEVLKKKFGGEKKARGILRISGTDWSRLGKLSNHEPIKQGRHRGKNFESLRDATEEELKEARQIVKKIIKKYFDFLEGKTSAS